MRGSDRENSGSMEELPEVLHFVISKVLTSGKKLSWSIWNNGEMTTVKLFWNPEAKLSQSSSAVLPPRSTSSHCFLSNVHKKKRSPSSKKRSNQRLHNFLANKKGQGVKTTERLELPTQISHPTPSSQGQQKEELKEESAKSFGNSSSTQVVTDDQSTVQPTTPTHTSEPEPSTACMEDSCPLIEVLQGPENIIYEARNDTITTAVHCSTTSTMTSTPLSLSQWIPFFHTLHSLCITMF